MIDFSGWLEGREWWLGLLVGISAAMFVGSLITVPWLVVRLPADYFAQRERHSWAAATGHPVLHWLALLAKNSLGVVLLMAGIAMLVLPGQGLLTMVMGLVLLDFPGKYRFERFVVSRPAVLKSLNWLRRRRGRPPLRL